MNWKKLLLLDDDIGFLEPFKDALIIQGDIDEEKILCFSEPSAFIEFYANNNMCETLSYIDFTMPGMNGFEVVLNLSRHDQKGVMKILTGNADNISREKKKMLREFEIEIISKDRINEVIQSLVET